MATHCFHWAEGGNLCCMCDAREKPDRKYPKLMGSPEDLDGCTCLSGAYGCSWHPLDSEIDALKQRWRRHLSQMTEVNRLLAHKEGAEVNDSGWCRMPASTPARPGALCTRRAGHPEPGLTCTADPWLASIRDAQEGDDTPLAPPRDLKRRCMRCRRRLRWWRSGVFCSACEAVAVSRLRRWLLRDEPV